MERKGVEYMPTGYPRLTPEQREGIVQRIREKGERVAALAKEYGVKPGTIYNLVSRVATGPNTTLEVARLKRENKALISIIGRMVADQKTGKKTRNE